MAGCKSAGDKCSSVPVGNCAAQGGSGAGLNCASGLDCSGLVSRAWGLTSHLGTGQLPGISTAISYSQLQQGDIVNKEGDHTRLIKIYNANGSADVIEAVGGVWKTRETSINPIQQAGYVPLCYNNVFGGCGASCTPPTNDVCSSTVPTLTVGPTCNNTPGDIYCATQSNAASGCPSGLIQDVWYKFTATSNGIYTIRLTPSSGMDGVVEVRQGSCTGTVLGCADSGGGNGGVENLNVTVTNGTTYYIRVYEYNPVGNTTPPATTTFNICIIGSSSSCPQPTNDGCTGSFSATLLTFGTACNPVSSTSCGATNSGFSSCVGNQDDDVFFRFTPTSTTATITVVSSAGYDAVFQPLSGTCGGSMTSLGCVDNTGTGGTETTILTGLTIGTQYFIRVWHFGTGYGTTGNFTICVYGSTALPDLTITNNTQTVTPGTVTAGANVTAGCSEDNSGNGFAGANHVTLWLSADNVLNTSNDVYLGQIPFPSLPPNSNSPYLTNTVQIPANTCSGNYFLFFWADGYEVIAETNNSNNFATRIITVNGTTLSTPTANASSNVNSTSFQANWNNVSGATSYRLDVSLNSSFSTYVPGYQDLNVGNVVSYPVTGLTCNTQYYYRIRAFNSCGTSGNSNTASVITSACCTAPSAPVANVATNINPTTFQANWNSVSGATSYRLDVSTSSTFSSYVPGYQDLNVGNVTLFSVTGLTCNTQYYYRIRANNSCGTSSNSNTANVITSACCNTPTSPTANAASNITATSFQANWNSVSGATSYRLDVSTNSGFSTYVPGYQDLNVGNVTSFNVSGLTCNTQYYYRIRANNSCGTSSNSNTINLTTSACCTPPTSPTANAASNITATSFQANWNNVSGATSYRLDVSTSSTFSSYVPGYQDLNVGNVTLFSVTGLICNTIYYYRIRANNSCGTSSNSNTINLTTSGCCTPPTNPTANAASTITATSFQANWSSVSGATSYRLDVSTSSTFSSYVPGYQDLNVGNVTLFSVTGLTCNTIYYYRVRANNSCGTSSNSNTINLTTSACCTPPTSPNVNPASNITSTTFNANWNPVSGATSYYLDVATNSTFSSYVPGYQNLNVGNVISFNVSGLTCNTSYYYRVRTFSNCGTSVSSGYISVLTTACCNPPINPNASAASNITSTTFNANWNAVSGATSYYIDVATNSIFTNFVTGYNNLNAGNTTSLNVNSLTCSTNYYYRVRAFNNCGTSGNSGIISVVTAVCCNPPSNPTVNAATNVTSTTFNANWNAVSGASSYYIDVASNSAFTNFVTGYNNQNAGNITSLNVIGLTCNTNYYYRVRAFSNCGTSINSGITGVLTSTCCNPPNSPIIRQASNISSTAFTANWNTVNGASSYYLDVATNLTFTNFVNGYNNLGVGNTTLSIVTGLDCNTAYFYRVRAFNNCGQSVNSGIFSVQTSSCFINNIDGLEEFSVMPNPNSGNFVIKMKLTSVKDVSFKIYNNSGQLVYTTENHRFSGPFIKNISLTNLSHGVYSLQTIVDIESFTVNIVVQ